MDGRTADGIRRNHRDVAGRRTAPRAERLRGGDAAGPDRGRDPRADGRVTVSRRRFFRDAAALAIPIVPLVAARRLHAQQVTQSFAGPMEQDAYRPVNLPVKPGAKPSMTDAARDDLEHSIKC